MNAFIKNSLIKVLTVALLIVAQFFIISAHAQPTPRNLAGDANSAPDLVFPSEPTPISEANYPKMMLLKPEGAGPFPALLMGHQCGGLVFSKANPPGGQLVNAGGCQAISSSWLRCIFD